MPFRHRVPFYIILFIYLFLLFIFVFLEYIVQYIAYNILYSIPRQNDDERMSHGMMIFEYYTIQKRSVVYMVYVCKGKYGRWKKSAIGTCIHRQTYMLNHCDFFCTARGICVLVCYIYPYIDNITPNFFYGSNSVFSLYIETYIYITDNVTCILHTHTW